MAENMSLKTFLRTGELGSIKPGLNRNEVTELLGEPDDVGGTSRKHREPAVWKYGDVELLFDRETRKLSLIVINFWEPNVPSAGAALDLDPWIVKGGLQASDLTVALESEGIRYEEVSALNPGTRQFLVSSSITLIFKEDQEEDSDWTGLRKVVAGSSGQD